MNDYRDLALADAAHDRQRLDEAFVSAMTDAVTYRDLFLKTVCFFGTLQLENLILRQRVRQLMGIEPGHAEGDDGQG